MTSTTSKSSPKSGEAQSASTNTQSDGRTSDPTADANVAARLLDHMTTAVIALDNGLKVAALNTAAEQLLGVSASKAIGRRLAQIVIIPDSLFARLREAVELGQPVNGAYRLGIHSCRLLGGPIS